MLFCYLCVWLLLKINETIIKGVYLFNDLIVDDLKKVVMHHGFEFQDIGKNPKILQDLRAHTFTSASQDTLAVIL